MSERIRIFFAGRTGQLVRERKSLWDRGARRRLLSYADMIHKDRGPDSQRCAEFYKAKKDEA